MRGLFRNRVVLAGAALFVGVVIGACVPPAGGAGQDRTYFACAGVGGVIDPTSLRIDNQPTCEQGKTLQQWTQHADTSDLVGVTVVRTGNGAEVRAEFTETPLNCYGIEGIVDDCSAIAIRGVPYVLRTEADPAVTKVTWTGCDNPLIYKDWVQSYECHMDGTHGATVGVDFSPANPG